MMVRMEQNIVLVMLDEEISRLQQMRTILLPLVTVEARVAPLLVAAAAQPEAPEDASAEVPALTRHVSRRGITTGPRGPRRAKQAVAPRPLDAAVPQGPVVVSRSALAPTKQVLAADPVPALEGTLESWVRSVRQASQLSN